MHHIIDKGSRQIGDEGVKQICALDTLSVRMMIICKGEMTQFKTIFLQSAWLPLPL